MQAISNRRDMTKRTIVKTTVSAGIFLAVVFALVFEILREQGKSPYPVYISEYMSDNASFYIKDGKAPDWIELHNPSPYDIPTEGFSLWCGLWHTSVGKDTLKAGEHIVVPVRLWDHIEKITEGIPFLAKRESRREPVITLRDGKRLKADVVHTVSLKTNCSVFRSYSDDPLYEGKRILSEEISDEPTPGFSNDESGRLMLNESMWAENTTGIFISEVMSSNRNVLKGSLEDYPDLIELTNHSVDTVDISGFGLTDNVRDVFKFRFQEGVILAPGAQILIECSSRYDGDSLRAGFSIANNKDQVFLCNREARLIDRTPVISTKADQSLQRLFSNDGTSHFAASYNVNLGYDNTIEGAVNFVEDVFSRNDLNKPYISEVMTRNTIYIPVDGRCYDWIELHNPTDSSLSLKGWSLSDDRRVPGLFTFPDVTIDAHAFLTIYSSEDMEGSSNLNTGFDLNGCCSLYLYDDDGKLLDSMPLSDMKCNVSKGRSTDGKHLGYFQIPTPGHPNIGTPLPLIAEAPVADIKEGAYDGVDSLVVRLSAGGKIRYTTDGSEPKADSKTYDGPIVLRKTTVIRAISTEDGLVDSPSAMFTYLLNENCGMDVMSLASDPDGLFSFSRGIFAMGAGAEEVFPFVGANFWKKWDRVSCIQFLPQKGEGFTIECDASIFGGYSKGYPKKSIKCKFRDIHGAGELHYPLFPNRDFDNYDAIVLRTGGQDWNGSMMRDDLTSTLCDGILDVMASRPCVLYINGEYWGIYYIREKINSKFIASHYGVTDTSVDIIQGNRIVNCGSREDWIELMDYVKGHDLTNPECYEWVKERVDLENYADYVIAEIFCGNTDAGNIRRFRSSDSDNKWRWILYDTDMGFHCSLPTGPFVYLNPEGNGADKMFSTALINQLLKNSDFHRIFVDRLEYQMKEVWSVPRVIGIIDRIATSIESQISRDDMRWNRSRDWDEAVDELRYFAWSRHGYLRKEFETNPRLRQVISLDQHELDRCFGPKNSLE